MFASRRTCSRGAIVRRNRDSHSASNFARDTDTFKSTPSTNASTSMVACVDEDKERFARSQAVLKRRSARWFCLAWPARALFFRSNSRTQWSTSRLSKSSPPVVIAWLFIHASYAFTYVQTISSAGYNPTGTHSCPFLHSHFEMAVDYSE